MDVPRLLIVDDDPVNLKVLQSLLGRENYDIVVAQSGREALDLAKANPCFELILLDVVMPDLDGIQITRALRENDATRDIPIVLITAQRTDDASIAEGLQAGADGYLTKPIDDTALKAWVRAALRISTLQRRVGNPGTGLPESTQSVLETVAHLSHDVNNVLQAMYASLDILSLDLEDLGHSRAQVDEVLAHAENLSQLIAGVSHNAKAALGRV